MCGQTKSAVEVAFHFPLLFNLLTSLTILVEDSLALALVDHAALGTVTPRLGVVGPLLQCSLGVSNGLWVGLGVGLGVSLGFGVRDGLA